MQNSSEESLNSKRVFKRVLIVLAVIESIVTAVGMYYYLQR